MHVWSVFPVGRCVGWTYCQPVDVIRPTGVLPNFTQPAQGRPGNTYVCNSSVDPDYTGGNPLNPPSFTDPCYMSMLWTSCNMDCNKPFPPNDKPVAVFVPWETMPQTQRPFPGEVASALS